MTRLAELLAGRSMAEMYDAYWAPHLLAPFAAALSMHAKAGDQVLDLGCGTGLVASLAAARVGTTGSVTGADPTTDFLDTAKRTELACAAQWIEAPAEKLPIADESFDLVLCHQVLQYVTNVHAALRESARVLKRGGRLVIGVWSGPELQPCYGPLERGMARHLGEAYGRFHSLSFGGLDRLADLMRSSGLAMTRAETIVLPAPFASIRQFVELQCAGGARPLTDGSFAMGLFDLDDARFEPAVEAVIADMERELGAYAATTAFPASVACDVAEAVKP